MKTYRSILPLILMIYFFGSVCAEGANTVQVGNLFYRIDVENNTAQVTFNYDEEYNNYVGLPSNIEVPPSIEIEEKAYTVTAIGPNAFEMCGNLTSVVLPNTLTTLGEGAFSGTAITSITLPEGIVEIPGSLFSYTPLESITLPSSIRAIGDFAFYACDKLKEIQNIDKVISVGKEAFRHCRSIESLTLSNAKEIEKESFKECSSLKEVNLGNEELTIGQEAFAECRSLTRLNFGNGATTIGDNAFSECEALTDLVFPKNIQSIGYCAFYDCKGLSSVTFEDGDKELLLGSSPFTNSPFTYLYLGRNVGPLLEYSSPSSFFTSNKQIEKVVIGDSVTSIPNQLFRNSQSLQEVSFGANVKEVLTDAFADCKNLLRVECSSIDNWSKINFDDPDSNPFSNGAKLYVGGQLVCDVSISSEVTAIGRNVFAKYKELKTLEIPESVESIGDQAFFECDNLKSVIIRPGLKEYGDGAFLRCTNLNDVYCHDIESWIESNFNNMYSNPIMAETKFYINGELLTVLELPEGPSSIGKNCFNRYNHLTKVIIPESVVKVGNYAFVNYMTKI